MLANSLFCVFSLAAWVTATAFNQLHTHKTILFLPPKERRNNNLSYNSFFYSALKSQLPVAESCQVLGIKYWR